MSNGRAVDQFSPEENDGVHAGAESPVLLHVWEVDPGQEGVAVQRLSKMFREVAAEPGFVSARLLASADRRSIAALVEMRTSEDRARLDQLPVVRDTVHSLDGTFNLTLRLYYEVGTYSA